MAGCRLLNLATPRSSRSLGDRGRAGRGGGRVCRVSGPEPESGPRASPPAAQLSAPSHGRRLRRGGGVILSCTGALWGLVLRLAGG